MIGLMQKLQKNKMFNVDMKAFQKHSLMLTPACLFLLGSKLIHMIHVMSCSYDNFLNSKSFISFWDGNPFVFLVLCVTAIKSIDCFFFFIQVVFCIISLNKLLFKHCHKSRGAFMATEWNGRR